MVDTFIQSIHNKKKIRITYFAKKHNENVTRLCAPMDFAPSSVSKDKTSKLHFWDYESTSGRHTTSKKVEDIVNIEVTDIGFDPSDFVNWDTNWTISRDWGQFS